MPYLKTPMQGHKFMWAMIKMASAGLGYIGDEILPSYMGVIKNHKRIPIDQPVYYNGK